jgi:multiple sugar transport system permease protein
VYDLAEPGPGESWHWFGLEDGMEQVTPRKRSLGELIRHSANERASVLFPAPALLIMLILYAAPVAYAVFLSFTKWNFSATTMPVWLGLANYQEVLANDRFWAALFNTLYYAALALVVQLPLGMAIAMVFNMNFPGRGALRTLFLFPMMATPLAAMLGWRSMLDPNAGVPQLITNALGIDPISLLSMQEILVPVLVVVDTWQWTPFVTLILLAGLQALPVDPYESGRIDGASNWQLFWHLTIPLMRWSIVIAMVFRLIDSLKVFETIFILSPGASSGGLGAETLNIYTYHEALEYFHMGYASALVVLFFVLIFGLSMLVLRLRRSES